MQPRDLMYAFHIVSLHIHNNRHAQNFFFFIFGTILTQSLLYSPESIFTSITLIHKLHKSLNSCSKLILLAIASACALFQHSLPTTCILFFEEHPYVVEDDFRPYFLG